MTVQAAMASPKIGCVPCGFLVFCCPYPSRFCRSIIKSDGLLSSLPVLAIALQLATEWNEPSSPFHPYISTLPRECTNCLYFTSIDFNRLWPIRDAFTSCARFLRTAVKQWCYVVRLIPHLTWRVFRWSVAIVMSRQNVVPLTPDDNTIALIPLWDLLNHAEVCAWPCMAPPADTPLLFTSTGASVHII